LVNKLQRKFRKNDFDNSEYVAAIFGVYQETEIMEKSTLSKFIDIKFENETFKAIEKYDVYLSSIYGDYMKLPPEEKRVSHHSFEAYYKDK
jgi:lipopolysaccharide cholinephosphotransferase